MYSFMSKHFDNNNIVNNHVIKIIHYQIFVVVYQNTNIEEMYDYDIYWLWSDLIIIIT